MDDEALSGSWTTRSPASCWPCAASGGDPSAAALTGRCRCSSIQCMQALRVSAADVSRQLKQVQVEAAGGRTDLGGAEQSVRCLPRCARQRNWPRYEIALNDGPRPPRPDRYRRRYHRRAARGGNAQRQTGGGLRGVASKGPARSR